MAIIANVLRSLLQVIRLLGPRWLELWLLLFLRHERRFMSLEWSSLVWWIRTIRKVNMREFSFFHCGETHLLLVDSPLFLHEVLTIRPLGWLICGSKHWVLHSILVISSLPDHLCGPHLRWFLFVFWHQRWVVKSFR